MELHSARLLLRPYRASDLADLHTILSDPAMGRWMDWRPSSPEGTAVFLGYALQAEAADPRATWKFAVVRTDGGELIGSAELHVESLEHRRGTMGYLIAPAAQGQGYATEAARAVLDFGLTDAGLHRITATCDPGNTGSVRVLEKAGLTREGHLRDHLLIRGEWRDRLLFGAVAQLR
jgi:[ribosomal protein S5]-alanine N-acetyltransferase